MNHILYLPGEENQSKAGLGFGEVGELGPGLAEAELSPQGLGYVPSISHLRTIHKHSPLEGCSDN